MKVAIFVTFAHISLALCLFYFQPLQTQKKIVQRIKVCTMNFKEPVQTLVESLDPSSLLTSKIPIEEANKIDELPQIIQKPVENMLTGSKAHENIQKPRDAISKKEQLRDVSNKTNEAKKIIMKPNAKTAIKKNSAEKKLNVGPPKPVLQKKKAAVKASGANAVNKSQNADKKRLANMLQEGLESLSKNNSQSKNSSLKKRNDVSLSSELINLQATYQNALISLLEEKLQLPENGSVKIKLTLKKDGIFNHLEFVKCSSERNRKYVEETLHPFVFPSFQKYFPKENTHTFLITLTSEK